MVEVAFKVENEKHIFIIGEKPRNNYSMTLQFITFITIMI